jgi:hypothetical protein
MNDHSDDTTRSGPGGTGPEDEGEERLPPGVEGTRGDKDSAEGARRHFDEQRGLQPVAAPTSDEAVQERGGGSEDGDGEQFEGRSGSFGDTFAEAEAALAVEALLPPGAEAEEGAVAADVGVQAITVAISGARTASQAGTQNVFRRTTDALALVLDVVASQDLVNAGLRFDANFQIIEFTTNTVRRNVWTRNSPFSWGTHFWISQGNNWGPASAYTTPEKWDLPVGVYALRGTIEVLGGPGVFAFSAERQFRVR